MEATGASKVVPTREHWYRTVKKGRFRIQGYAETAKISEDGTVRIPADVLEEIADTLMEIESMLEAPMQVR